jgi:hypothetical protein
VRLEDCLRHIWRNNATKGFAVARADATSGREADAERLAATIKAITGEEPRIRRKSESAIEVICGRERLDGFKRYAELADAIEKWQEEARAPPTGRGHRAYFMAHKQAEWRTTARGVAPIFMSLAGGRIDLGLSTTETEEEHMP